MTRISLVLAVLLGAAGVVGFGIGAGSRAAWSFAGGYGLTLGLTAFACASVVIAGRLSPAFSLLGAMMNYTLTILVLVVVLKNVDRDQAHVAAAVSGLLIALVPFLTWQLGRARPQPLTDAERAAVEAASHGRSTLS